MSIHGKITSLRAINAILRARDFPKGAQDLTSLSDLTDLASFDRLT